MMKSVAEIAGDQYGRKVLLYLLSPRHPTHFHPKVVELLQKGDDKPNKVEYLHDDYKYLFEYTTFCKCSYSRLINMNSVIMRFWFAQGFVLNLNYPCMFLHVYVSKCGLDDWVKIVKFRIGQDILTAALRGIALFVVNF